MLVLWQGVFLTSLLDCKSKFIDGSEIIVFDTDANKMSKFVNYGITIAPSIDFCLKIQIFINVGIKPQNFRDSK